MIKVHKASEFLKTPEDVAAYLNATIEKMDDPRLLMKAFRNIAEAQGGVSELSRRAMFDWLRLVAPRMFPQADAAAAIASLEREFAEIATEEGEMMALAKRVQEWEAEWHRQGFEEGLKQGLAAERELLCRQAARRFGTAIGNALVRHLADISDPERLAGIGERIVDCGTGTELLEWLDTDRDGTDAH